MLKLIRVIDYDGNYVYSPPDVEAVVNTEEIASAMILPRGSTRRAFDDVTRLFFRDGTSKDMIGKPRDLIELGG